MPNVDYPTEPVQPKTRSNCLIAGGVTCLVMVVLLILLGIWAWRMAAKNPSFRNAYDGFRLVAICDRQLQDPNGSQDVYDALERYKTRYGKYPASLNMLYPDFLEKRDVLHCPADKGPKNSVSYEYTPPAPDASPDALLAQCRRHIIVRGQPPMILRLTKDGRVLRLGFNPRDGMAEPKSPGE